MSSAEEKAALASGVVLGNTPDGTGLTGILYRGTASTSNTIIVLPTFIPGGPTGPITTPVAGKWINVFSETSNVQLAVGIGTSAPVLTYNSDVSSDSGSLIAGATIPAGVVFPVLIPGNAKYISFIAAGSTGKVELYVSEILSGSH